MGELGMGEMLVILVLVVLLFGTKKLPELGEGLGRAIRNFKQAASGADEDASGKAAREGGDAKVTEQKRLGPPAPPAQGA